VGYIRLFAWCSVGFSLRVYGLVVLACSSVVVLLVSLLVVSLCLEPVEV